VFGGGFLNQPEFDVFPRARFGEKEVRCDFNSTTLITCEIPKNKKATGKTPFEISFNGEDWTTSTQSFTYYEKPDVDYIYPNTGPVDGGTVIEFHGKGFTSDTTPGEFNCKFSASPKEGDDAEAPAPREKIVPAKFESSEVVVCTTPGGWDVDDEVGVEITFNGMDYYSFNKTIGFYQIDGIEPQSAPSGGTSHPIKLVGSGFEKDSNATLRINNEDYKPTSINDDGTEILFDPPALNMGAGFTGNLELEASVNGRDFIKFPDGY
jgi:hypothetical protein